MEVSRSTNVYGDPVVVVNKPKRTLTSLFVSIEKRKMERRKHDESVCAFIVEE